MTFLYGRRWNCNVFESVPIMTRWCALILLFTSSVWAQGDLEQLEQDAIFGLAGDQIAAAFHLQLALEQFRRGFVTDGDEDPVAILGVAVTGSDVHRLSSALDMP